MFIVILVEVVGVVDGGAVWMAAMGMMLLLMDCRIVQHTAEQRRLDE
jgi:hypothetical protein